MWGRYKKEIFPSRRKVDFGSLQILTFALEDLQVYFHVSCEHGFRKFSCTVRSGPWRAYFWSLFASSDLALGALLHLVQGQVPVITLPLRN